MKKPLKWAITILGMLAVFAVVYICGEKFSVTAGPIPTLVLMLAVYVAGVRFNIIKRYIALEARRERC